MRRSLCARPLAASSKNLRAGACPRRFPARVRLHGRNFKNWFAENRTVNELYDYLYAPKELEPWVDRVKKVAQQADDTYVVTNNHNLGKAVVHSI